MENTEAVLVLNAQDEAYLKEIDTAFRGDTYRQLRAQNQVLQAAAQRWLQEARRNRRAFLMASILAGAGWLLLIGLAIRLYARG